MFDYTSAVTRGAALLDDAVKTGLLDAGWEERIDTDTLRLSSCHDCVLGQLAGHYATGMSSLFDGLDTDDINHASEYGFNVPLDDSKADYAPLTKAWVDEIQSRRSRS